MPLADMEFPVSKNRFFPVGSMVVVYRNGSCPYCSFSFNICFLSALIFNPTLIQVHLLTLVESIFSARELKPVKYLELFKSCIPS